MPRTVIIDELVVTLRVPAGLPDRDARAVRRALGRAAFLRRLRAAVRGTVRAYPALAAVRVAVAR